MYTDSVNRPAHYVAGNIECIDAIREALGLDGFLAYCRGNAMKYTWRAGLKGDAREDLRKAAWYCTAAADAMQRQRDGDWAEHCSWCDDEECVCKRVG